MGLKLRQRSVYLGTIVAVLALIGGFAMATALSGITGPASVSQNAGTIVTTTNTMFAGSVSVNLVQAALASSSLCDVSVAWPSSPPSTPLAVYVTGTNACISGAGATDWFEEVSWAAVTVPAPSSTVTDTFYITTAGGASPNTVTFTVTTPSGAAGGTGALNVYLDVGPTVTGGNVQSPTAYTGISISVNQV
jgi:hypothetical protein